MEEDVKTREINWGEQTFYKGAYLWRAEDNKNL
jgi:hypothetical protein